MQKETQASLLILGEGYVAQHILSAAGEISRAGTKHFDGGVAMMRYDPIDTNRRIASWPDSAWVVNATGYCGVSNVDDCELDPARTWYANHAIAVHVAKLCAHYKKKLLHISSGCIFNDLLHHVSTFQSPNPIGTYQKSKAAAERDVERIMADHEYIIARIRMPFSNADCRRNYLSKFITHQKIWESPEYSMSHLPEMAKLMVEDMLATAGEGQRDVVHYVNSGTYANDSLMRAAVAYGVMPRREIVPSGARSYAVLSPHPRAGNLIEAVESCLANWRWR